MLWTVAYQYVPQEDYISSVVQQFIILLPTIVKVSWPSRATCSLNCDCFGLDKEAIGLLSMLVLLLTDRLDWEQSLYKIVTLSHEFKLLHLKNNLSWNYKAFHKKDWQTRILWGRYLFKKNFRNNCHGLCWSLWLCFLIDSDNLVNINNRVNCSHQCTHLYSEY